MGVAVDTQGKPFAAGQKVVYPVRRSSFMWVNTAEVLELNINERGRTYLKVKVFTTRWNSQTLEHEPCTRITTVGCLDRVTIVADSIDK